jgi:hypothetical protein
MCLVNATYESAVSPAFLPVKADGKVLNRPPEWATNGSGAMNPSRKHTWSIPVKLLAPLLCAGWCMAASGQELSAGELSACLVSNYTAGSLSIIAGQPRLLKVLGSESGLPSGMVQAMRHYKLLFSGGKLVVRIDSPRTYSLTNDATLSAGDFWTNVLQQSLGTLHSADRALIDYLEGPNEGQTPTLDWDLAAAQWLNEFWTNLTPRIVAAGYRPCIGSLAAHTHPTATACWRRT